MNNLHKYTNAFIRSYVYLFISLADTLKNSITIIFKAIKFDGYGLRYHSRLRY